PAEFPVPKLTQATGTGTSVTLAPLNAQNGGTVSVEYTPMYTTDSIKVTMVGTAGAGSPVIPAKNGVATGKATFDITKAAIAANVGNTNKTVTLYYEVTRNGKVVSSQVLTVTVTPIPQAELAKTVLKINQANAATQVLDLTTFTGNATGQIGVWPFITAPYPVWLKLLGKTDKGVDHSLTVYNGAGSAAVNPTWIANGKIEPGIARSYLEGVGHGTKLQVELKAAFSVSKVEAEAISFPVVEYTIYKPALSAGGNKTLAVPGYHVIQGAPPANPPAAAVYTQSATGGVRPYRYSSADKNVATVDELTGRVVAAGKGTTKITVTDNVGTTASYTLTISGLTMWRQVHNGNPTIQNAWPRAVNAIASSGTRFPTQAECRVLADLYRVGGLPIIHIGSLWLGNQTILRFFRYAGTSDPYELIIDSDSGGWNSVPTWGIS
ncbi:Ig-like domain-containing protein, partial [Pseudomonas lactis]